MLLPNPILSFCLLFTLYTLYTGKYNSAFLIKEKDKCGGKGSINMVSESDINQGMKDQIRFGQKMEGNKSQTGLY